MSWQEGLQQEITNMDITQNKQPIKYVPEKVDKADKAVLVIGLGGTGLRITHRAKEMFIQRFKPAVNPAPDIDPKLPDKTRFLAIDADENDFDRFGFFDNERCEIGLSNLGTLLDKHNRHLLPTYITDWLNKDVQSGGTATGVDGAQGIRQIGRFMLFQRVGAVVQKIQSALNAIREGMGTIYIIIAAGIAGGTGAGTFMDIPYLVRHVANHLGLTTRIKIVGLLAMPDCFDGLGDDSASNIRRANAYAGLKELDYWMDVKNKEHAFQQQYDLNLIIPWSEKTYDTCILLSATNMEGIIKHRPLEAMYGVAAEFMVNIFASEKFDSTIANVDNGFSFSSYLSNVETHRATRPPRFNTNNSFLSIGASNGQIPLQDLFLLEGIHIFDEIGRMFDNAPDFFSPNMFQEFIKTVVASKIQNAFDGVLHINPSADTPQAMRSSNSIASHDKNRDPRIRSYNENLDQKLMSAEMNNLIRDIVINMEQNLISIFCDREKGPFYALRMLSRKPGLWNTAERKFDVFSDGNFSLRDILQKELDTAINEKRDAMAEEETQYKIADPIYKWIKTALLTPTTWDVGRVSREYYPSATNVLEAQKRQRVSAAKERLYTEMLKKLDIIEKEVFLPLVETLKELVLLYRSFPSFMKSPAYLSSRNPFFRDIVSFENLDNNFVNTYLTQSKRTAILENLLKDMLKPYTIDQKTSDYTKVPSAEQWLKKNDLYPDITEKINIRSNLQRILNFELKEYNNKSITEFLRIENPNFINTDGSLNSALVAANIINEDLTPHASALFSSDPMYPITGNAFTSARFITVPRTAVGLKAAINPNNLNVVKESEIADRIFLLSTVAGISMYNYAGLALCEQAYENSCIHGNHKGSHLYEGNAINWNQLPNPKPILAYPEGTAGDGTVSRTRWQQDQDKSLIARIEALLQKDAYRIVNTDQGNKLEIYLHNADSKALLKELEADLKANVLTLDQVKAKMDEMKAKSQKLSIHIDSRPLASYEGHGGINALARDMLIERPKLIEKMEETTLLNQALIADYNRLVQNAGEAEVFTNFASTYADLLAFDIIKHEGMRYHYYLDGVTPTSVYYTVQDNKNYLDYLPAKCMDCCVAAKLIDMQEEKHPEHQHYADIQSLYQHFITVLNEGIDESQIEKYVTNFQNNAQNLKSAMDVVKNSIHTSLPTALGVSPQQKSKLMLFLTQCINKLNSRSVELTGTPLK